MDEHHRDAACQLPLRASRTGIRVIALSSQMVACGTSVTTPAWPIDPDAMMRDDLIVLSDDVVEPGQIVELRFPAETDRGVLFVLDSHAGDVCTPIEIVPP